MVRYHMPSLPHQTHSEELEPPDPDSVLVPVPEEDEPSPELEPLNSFAKLSQPTATSSTDPSFFTHITPMTACVPPFFSRHWRMVESNLTETCSY